MAAGIHAAKGRVLIPMDADLQNDPADIARLLEKLDEGYDVVSGWRKNRQDPLFTRKIPSQMANWLISKIGGVPLHDYGCSLKAYRRESLEMFSSTARCIASFRSTRPGRRARSPEIPVEHHARTMGKSKYGLSRTIKVVFDLMTIKFMASYQTKPLYMFGSAGLLTFAVSLLCAVFAFLMKFASWPHHADFIQTPLPVLTMVLLVLGYSFSLWAYWQRCWCDLPRVAGQSDLCGEGKNWVHHRGHREEQVIMMSCEPGHSCHAEVSTVRVSGWDKESTTGGTIWLGVDPSDADGTDLVLCG
jgi:hypothetical protein